MQDSMQYDAIQGQDQGHEPFKVGIPAIFKSCLLRHLQWELAADHGFLNFGTMFNLAVPDFCVVLVSVSRDFELGRTISCEESTVSQLQSDEYCNHSCSIHSLTKYKSSKNHDFFLHKSSHWPHMGSRVVLWPNSFLIPALYKLFVCLFTSLLSYLLTSLSNLTIGPFCFQAGILKGDQTWL